MANIDLIKVTIEQLFNASSCPYLLVNLTHLLRCASTRHHMYSEGPVRQALLTQVTDALDHGRPLGRQSGIALVRMQLETGATYSMQFSGQFGDLLDRVNEVGTWLAGKAYDEGGFARTERELAVLINDVNRKPCEIRLDRNADVVTQAGISVKKVSILVLGALNVLRAAEGLPPLDRCPDELTSWFAEALSPSHPACAQFLANLEQDILASTNSTGKAQPLRIYNFLAEARGDARRNRLQAVGAMPVLMHMFTGCEVRGDQRASAEFSSRAAADILGAIDAAAPLLGAIAATLDVPPETVRWLRQRTLPPAWRMSPDRLKALLTLLSWIAPEKRPDSHVAFDAMIEAARAMSEMLTPLLMSAQGQPAPLPPDYGPLFRRWLAELMWPGDPCARAGALTAGAVERADTSDFLLAALSSLRRFCTIDTGAFAGTDDPRLAVLLAWLRTRSLCQLMGLSRRWHVMIAERMAQCALEAPGAVRRPPRSAPRWPGVLEHPLRVGAFALVELTDTLALQAEGQAMLHCVGSYTSQCMSGNSLVFSVRDEAGTSLSTVELHLHLAPLQVRQGQHRSTMNSDVSSDCQAAVEALVRFLNRAEQGEALALRHAFQQARLHELRMQHRAAADHAEEDGLALDAATWSLICGGAAPPAAPITLGVLAVALGLSSADTHR